MSKKLTEALNTGKFPPRNWMPIKSRAKEFAIDRGDCCFAHGLLDTIIELDKHIENPEEDWVECHVRRDTLDYAGRLLDYIFEQVQKSGQSTCIKFFANGDQLVGYLLLVHDGSDAPVTFRGAIPTPYTAHTGKLHSVCPLRSEADKCPDYRGRLHRLHNRLEAIAEVVPFGEGQRLSLRIKPLKESKCAV